MEKPTYQGQQPSKEREWPPDGVESHDGIGFWDVVFETYRGSRVQEKKLVV